MHLYIENNENIQDLCILLTIVNLLVLPPLLAIAARIL